MFAFAPAQRSPLLFVVLAVFGASFAVCAAAGLTPLMETLAALRCWAIAACARSNAIAPTDG